MTEPKHFTTPIICLFNDMELLQKMSKNKKNIISEKNKWENEKKNSK
jgi:hypothetical protein